MKNFHIYVKHLTKCSLLVSGLVTTYSIAYSKTPEESGGAPIEINDLDRGNFAFIDSYWGISGVHYQPELPYGVTLGFQQCQVDQRIELDHGIVLVHFNLPFLGKPVHRLYTSEDVGEIRWHAGGTLTGCPLRDVPSGTLLYVETNTSSSGDLLGGYKLNDVYKKLDQQKINTIIIEDVLKPADEKPQIPTPMPIPSITTPQPQTTPQTPPIPSQHPGRKLVLDGPRNDISDLLERELKQDGNISEIELGGSSYLTDQSIETIVSLCPGINTLILSSTPVTKKALKSLSALKVLKTLNLAGCNYIKENDFNPLPESITSLDLSYTQATDNDIRYLAEHCPHLVELKLSTCKNISKESIELLSHLPNLKILDLVGCNLTKEDLAPLSRLHNLQALKTPDNTLYGKKRLQEYLKAFTILGLRGAHVNDTSVADKLKLQTPDIITKIDLTNSDVTDNGIKMITDNCPNLIELNVSSCPNIKDTALKYLAKLKDLNILNLEITDITGEHFEFLPMGLTNLNLRYTQITDQSIESLVKQCPHLENLNLTDCQKITDACIENISNLQNLKTLNISRCYGVKMGKEARNYLKNLYNLTTLISSDNKTYKGDNLKGYLNSSS